MGRMRGSVCAWCLLNSLPRLSLSALPCCPPTAKLERQLEREDLEHEHLEQEDEDMEDFSGAEDEPAGALAGV